MKQIIRWSRPRGRHVALWVGEAPGGVTYEIVAKSYRDDRYMVTVWPAGPSDLQLPSLAGSALQGLAAEGLFSRGLIVLGVSSVEKAKRAAERNARKRFPLHTLASIAEDNPVQLRPRTYWLGPHRWGAYHTLRANAGQKKPVPGFIRTEAEDASAQAQKVYRFLSHAYHPDAAITGREKRGLRPLNEGVFVHAEKFKKVSDAYRSLKRALEKRPFPDRKAAQLAYDELNKQLRPWLGTEPVYARGPRGELLKDPDTEEPVVRIPGDPRPQLKTTRGEVIFLELPENYRPREEIAQAERATRKGVEKAREIYGEKKEESQKKRLETLEKAATYVLRRQYTSGNWFMLDRAGLAEQRVADTVGVWIEQTGIPEGLTTKKALPSKLRGKGWVILSQVNEFSPEFEVRGLTPEAIKSRAATWNQNVHWLMDTMTEAAKEVRRRNIREDRRIIERESEAQRVRASDLWTAAPRTPEEELGYRRGESAEAQEDISLKMLNDMLKRLEASGPVGKLKADIIRLHLGEDLYPEQPASLLGRRDARGKRDGRTSKAFQDMVGVVYIINKRGNIEEKGGHGRGTTDRFHGALGPGRAVLIPGDDPKKPVRARIEDTTEPLPPGQHAVLTEDGRLLVLPSSALRLAPCPTCARIAKFLRVRNFTGETVSAIITEFANTAYVGEKEEETTTSLAPAE